MKNILLYAVILLAAIGCHKTAFEQDNIPSTSENIVSITVQVQLPTATTDTRVSTTPGEWGETWKTAWEQDDELTLVSTTLGSRAQNGTTLSCPTLSIESIDEDGIATFTGNVAEGEYYIYCVDAYTIDQDGQFAVDYTKQVASENCSGKPMKAFETITVSEEDGSTSFTDIVFSHISQTVELRVSFGDIGDDYTLSSIEISGALGEDADYFGFTSALLSFADKTVSSDDSFNAYCYLPQFTIANGESITLTANIQRDGNVYSSTYNVQNNTGADVEFIEGSYNYLTLLFSEVSAKYWSSYAATSFVEGAYKDGVTNYTIATAEQLAYLSNLVNKGNAMSGVTFTLGDNIDLSGRDWVAIGTSSSPFSGTFDGNSKTISNIYINEPDSDNQALFGYTVDAAIEKISVGGTVTGNSGVGGVVGSALNSSIINSYNAVSTAGQSTVGGVVGNLVSSSVTNSYNTASVSGVSSVGGVVGSATVSSTVTNCYNAASVVGSSPVGGVVGSSTNSSVTNSYWNSTVSSAVTAGVGQDDGSNVTTASPMTTSDMQAGGFATLLTNNAYYFNKNLSTSQACAWKAVSGDFPTLDFNDFAPAYAIMGSGTASDPYLISTAEELRLLSSNVAGGTSYNGLYLKMVQNIDLGGIDSDGNGVDENKFTPIGGNGIGNGFRGTFDGGGNTVSGLYINNSSSNQGLFGYIGVLSSVITIQNVSVSGSVTASTQSAGVVGYNNNGIVTNCHNYCKVTGSGTSAGTCIGGVVGYNSAGTITNCHNYGDISSTTFWTGGVAAYNNAGAISYCHNSGSISSSNTSSSSTDASIGGVVGYNTSTITYCYNSGEVEGYVLDVGGITGYNEGTVTNCYNTASVEGTYMYTGNVASTTGGIAGYNYGTTANCYSTGDVTGELWTGGVLGYNTTIGTLINCYSAGTVVGNNSDASYTGGVAGENNLTGIYSNCYWNNSSLGMFGDYSVGTTSNGSYYVSTSDMQSADFVTLLNSGAYSYNNPTEYTAPTIKACAWTQSSSYPTLDFTNLSPEYTALE